MTYPQHFQTYPAQPKSQPPSIALTVVITLVFGLFGLIPAFIHRDRARAMGRADIAGKYFAAVWTIIITAVVLVFLLAAAGGGR